jgi:HD-GYP domain-containing protein (c-di-GMP phosphodiesterase class II)
METGIQPKGSIRAMAKRGTERKDVIDAFGRITLREKDILQVECLVCEGARYLMGFEEAKLLRRDELDSAPEVAKRAASYRRITFEEDSFALPLFLGEKVGWILLVKGEVVDTDDELLEAFRINAGLALENAYFIKELETREAAIKIAVQALEERDPYTKGHSVKVAEYCRLIAEKLDKKTIREETGMSRREFEDTVYLAGLLHDVGKIGIREDILLKEEVLDDEEWLEMNTHPFSSKEIIGVGEERFKKIADVILHHHERVDGKGYPDGLEGKKIPFGSRVLAVADSFDAMTSNRVYRKAIPSEMALAEIKMLSEKWYGEEQYDKEVCKGFLSAVEEAPEKFNIKREELKKIDKVYDRRNRLLSKEYLTERLRKILEDIKGKSERTISVMLLSLDMELDEEDRISLLSQIKKRLPKFALFGNYKNGQYIILLPDRRAKDAYVKAEMLRRSGYKIKEEIKGGNIINIGIYEPLSSDRDRGLKPKEVYQVVESAHQEALKKKSIAYYRSLEKE